MNDSALKPPQIRTMNAERTVWRNIALALAVMTIIIYVMYLGLSLQFRNQLFLGVLVSHTNSVTAAMPSGDYYWSGIDEGIMRQDVITAINGQTLVTDPNDYVNANRYLQEVLAGFNEGDSVNVTFERDLTLNPNVVNSSAETICETSTTSIAVCNVNVQMMRLPELDFLAFFLMPFGAGIIVIIMGFVLLYYRGFNSDGITGAIISFLTAIFMGGLFDIGTTIQLTPLWILATCALGGMLINFSMIFPNRLRFVWKYPVTRYVPLLISLVVSVVLIYTYYNPATPLDTNYGQMATVYVLSCLVIMTAFVVLFQRPRALTQTTHQQTDIILIGTFLQLIPGVLWILNRALLSNTAISIPISFESLTPLFVLPNAAIAFSVLQFRRLDTDKIISNGITYAIMFSALIISIFFILLGTSLLAIDFFSITNRLGIAIVLFLMLIFFAPLRLRLQDRIDEIYYRSRRNYQGQVEEFSQKLVGSNSYDTITSEFVRLMDDNIQPSSIFIFLQGRENGEFIAHNKSTEVKFAANSPLVEILSNIKEAIVFNPGEPLPARLYTEQPRLRVLRAQVIAPLQGAGKLNGFVIISNPRSDKTIYTFEEIRFINLLSNQLAIGTERTQVISSLQQRVTELGVLSQVGQAVNFTIEFDVLLELIITQTSRLVDAPCYYIALYEESLDQMYFAFFLEKDDRETQKENQRWLLGNDLFSEVVKKSQSIRIDNYAFEMDKRGVPLFLETPQLRAWMGVPLSAGRRNLGVLAVGKTKSGETFTDEQFKIFNDVGALAATSLDKARLFTETKIRERQLTVLNDISRQLVATESDVEKLLQIIMSSAVDILNSEAGSLLLTAEDDADMLEFLVVIGGSEHLLNTRIDAKKGIAGQVMKTGKSLISNDIPRTQDNQVLTEYKTQSLLAVPLIAKDNVIGVLEVLNKKDGTMFAQEDSDLLTTLAGQAAVAIENARLFRMTDLQLAQRVRELETLERIDSELNRTLDVSEVAQITVRSAMKTLNAQAGALGIVHDSPPHLEIVSIEGYVEDEYPTGAEKRHWPLDKGIVRRVMRSRQPDIASDISIDPDYDTGLTGSLSQITLPMFSGDEINAIIILEKSQLPRFSLSDWAFAQRLAEHASIAIANAQLYAALTEANKSKSAFMGSAAHELGNPLTSVIGYADVIRSGAMGKLTEQQQGVINIIHSNANRMQTIIRDLRDSARMDANEFSVDVSPINIRHAVIETLRGFVQAIKEKEQELINLVPDDLPLILGDETRLIQVLTNLVSNANKYSPPNTSITVKADLMRNYVDRTGRKREPMLRISVIDQGLGISKEDQQRLFKERYFRSTNEVAKQQQGTGLGMPLTFGIIQKHNGDIWIESELGKGSAFHIVIPLAPQEVQTRLIEAASD